MNMRAYISQGCPNSKRLVDNIVRVERLRNSMHIIDVDQLSPDQRAGLQYVPTIVADGRQYIGSKAFEYLKQFDAEIELEPVSLGGRLAYASVEGDGGVQYTEAFGEFVVPPP